MNRIQLACYCLMASAFVLAAMLVVKVSDLNAAHAHMAVSNNHYVYMTARTASENEALFVIDKAANLLLVYEVEVRGRTRVELRGVQNLTQIFGQAPITGGGGGGHMDR